MNQATIYISKKNNNAGITANRKTHLTLAVNINKYTDPVGCKSLRKKKRRRKKNTIGWIILRTRSRQKHRRIDARQSPDRFLGCSDGPMARRLGRTEDSCPRRLTKRQLLSARWSRAQARTFICTVAINYGVVVFLRFWSTI